LEPAQVTLTLTPVSVVVAASGDVALEEGTWTWSNPNPDGSTTKDNGKYLVGWKKIDGTWLMQTDIWNSDNPPPAAPPAAKS
jgi:ketosteroid isomerase-like protein